MNGVFDVDEPTNQTPDEGLASSIEKLAEGNSSVVTGGVLILLGLLFIVGRLLNISAGRFLWPLFIIVPGVVLFAAALVTRSKASEGLAIFGSVMTMVGVVLFYQNATNHWQSWAYAWALVGPTAVGLGQITYGWLGGHARLVKTGKGVATTGITMFLIGAVFFELIIGISGFGLGSYAWPTLLIVAGLVLLIRTWLLRR